MLKIIVLNKIKIYFKSKGQNKKNERIIKPVLTIYNLRHRNTYRQISQDF